MQSLSMAPIQVKRLAKMAPVQALAEADGAPAGPPPLPLPRAGLPWQTSGPQWPEICQVDQPRGEGEGPVFLFLAHTPSV